MFVCSLKVQLLKMSTGMQLSRATQLVFLAYCSLQCVNHAKGDVTCTAGSFIVGSRGSVRCDFGIDVRIGGLDFNVVRYDLDDTTYESRKNLLACSWYQGNMECPVKAPSYQFDNKVDSTLTLTIPVVDKSMTGVYRCQLVPKPPDTDMHFCNFTVTDPPPTTTTKAPTTPQNPTTRPNPPAKPEVRASTLVTTDNEPTSTGTPENLSTPINPWSTDGTNQAISSNEENEGSDGAPIGLIVGVVAGVVVLVAVVVGFIVFWIKYSAKKKETPNGSEQDQDGCLRHILCCRPASSPKNRTSVENPTEEAADNEETDALLENPTEEAAVKAEADALLDSPTEKTAYNEEADELLESLTEEAADNEEAGKLLSNVKTAETMVDVDTRYAVTNEASASAQTNTLLTGTSTEETAPPNSDNQIYEDELSKKSFPERKKWHEGEIKKNKPNQNVQQRAPSQPYAHPTQKEVNTPDDKPTEKAPANDDKSLSNTKTDESNSQTNNPNSHRETNDEEVENGADDDVRANGGLKDEGNGDTLMQHDQLPPAPNAQVGSPVSPEPECDSNKPPLSPKPLLLPKPQLPAKSGPKPEPKPPDPDSNLNTT